MFLRISTLAVSMLLCVCIHAQISSSIHSNVSLTSLVDTSVWALSSNSSALAYSPKFSLGISHTNFFSMNNLSMSQILIAKNNSHFTTGVGFSYLGLQGFSYSSAELAIAKKIRGNFAIALKVFIEHLNEYETHYSQYRFVPEISAYAQLSPLFTLGTVFKNPLRLIQKENISEIAIGCNYKVLKKIQFLSVFVLNQQYGSQVSLGCAYKISPDFEMRIHVSNTNSPILFGIAYSRKKISIQYNSLFNSYLSLSHNLKLLVSI